MYVHTLSPLCLRPGSFSQSTWEGSSIPCRMRASSCVGHRRDLTVPRHASQCGLVKAGGVNVAAYQAEKTISLCLHCPLLPNTDILASAMRPVATWPSPTQSNALKRARERLQQHARWCFSAVSTLNVTSAPFVEIRLCQFPGLVTFNEI